MSESDYETLLGALRKRNLLSRTHRSKVAQEVELLIKECYHLVLLRLYRSLDDRRTP